MERRVLMTAEGMSVEMKMDSLDGQMEDTDEEVPIGALNGEDEKGGSGWMTLKESGRI